jgi:hypothetical protein
MRRCLSQFLGDLFIFMTRVTRDLPEPQAPWSKGLVPEHVYGSIISSKNAMGPLIER